MSEATGSPRVQQATAADVERLLAEGHLVVVDFYATWCAPCRTYTPKFERLAREVRRQHPDAKVSFVSVDIDRDHALARDGKVMSVPTTVAWRMEKGWFGRPKRKEALRFSGDRGWNELVRTFDEIVSRHAR